MMMLVGHTDDKKFSSYATKLLTTWPKGQKNGNSLKCTHAKESDQWQIARLSGCCFVGEKLGSNDNFVDVCLSAKIQY
jgi:hypothetical protein